MEDATLFARDHNNPPELVEAVTSDAATPVAPPTPFDTIKLRVDALIQTANKWAVERPKITDEEMAQKCAGFRAQIKGELKAAETQRRAEMKPHETVADEISSRFKTLMTLLETVEKILAPRATAYLVEKQRLLTEERAKAAAAAQALKDAADKALREAEVSAQPVQATIAAEQAKVAANEAAKAVRALPQSANVKFAGAAKASGLRTTWFAEITDLDTLYVHYRDHEEHGPKITALLQSIADAEVRGGAGRDGRPAIPGTKSNYRQAA